MSKSLNDISSTGKEEVEDLGDEGTSEEVSIFLPSCSRIASSNPSALNSTGSSDESGSSSNRFQRDTLTDQLCGMFGVIHQAIETLEKSETSGVKEFTKKSSGVGGSENREAKSFQTPDESIPVDKTLNQVKTLVESTVSRSNNKAECSNAIESMFDTIQKAVSIAQEATGKSEEDFTNTILGEGSSSTGLGNLNYTFQSGNSNIQTNRRIPSETTNSLERETSRTVHISNKAMVEIDRSLVSSIRITDVLEDIHITHDEIAEMIGTMLETQETTGQLSSGLQQTIAAFRNTDGDQERGQEHYDTSEGDCLLEEVRRFRDDIKVDIATWSTFRRKIKFYKKYILQHGSISRSIYCDYNRAQEIRFRIRKLLAKMKESRDCRIRKDEDFLKINEKIRTFARNARVIRERGTQNLPNSPERKRVCK